MKKENKQKTIVNEKTKAEKVLMRFVWCWFYVNLFIFSLVVFASLWNYFNYGSYRSAFFKIISWIRYWFCGLREMGYFYIYLVIPLLSFILAIISKVKKYSKIRAKFWVKVFKVTLVLFLLFCLVVLLFDYTDIVATSGGDFYLN